MDDYVFCAICKHPVLTEAAVEGCHLECWQQEYLDDAHILEDIENGEMEDDE